MKQRRSDSEPNAFAEQSARAPRTRGRLLPQIQSLLGLVLFVLTAMAGGRAVGVTDRLEHSKPVGGAALVPDQGAHASLARHAPNRLPGDEPAAVESEKDDDNTNGSSAKTAVTFASDLIAFDDVRGRSRRSQRPPETGRPSVSTGLARGPPLAG